MLIIKEDTLIHTDSSSDVIEHFGVKGMRWGQRRSRANVMPRVGQFSGRIKKNLVTRKNMKRNNEKKIASMSKNDPKRRELINKNKDLTNMNPEQIRYANNKALEKNRTKVLSNKKGISYKDAKAEVRAKTWGKSDAAKAAYKETKSQYGRKDLRTKAAKSDYKSAKASAQAAELKKYYGDWHGRAGNVSKLQRKSAHEAEKAKRYRMGV